MKLATYHDGSRDGQLIVVSRDLATAHYANGIASRLQQVLDDWNFLSPQLEDLSTALNHGKARHAFAFEPAKCMAPLPRVHHWAQGQAWLAHLQRAHALQGGSLPEAALGEPQLRAGPGDNFLPPCGEARFARVQDSQKGGQELGLDVEAGLCAVTGDVAAGASPAQGLEAVRLLMLSHSYGLRETALNPLDQAVAFSPVAVTPDELGEAWQGGRVQLPLQLLLNGRKLGLCDAGQDMSFHFGQLLAQRARLRPLGSGSLIGTGPVSLRDAAAGHASLADKRAQEALDHGAPRSAWLQYGDSLRSEIKGRDGLSLFGAIEHQITEQD